MKYIKHLLLVLMFSNCQAQTEQLLKSKTSVSDLSNTRIYERLTEEVDGEVVWKEKYKYIDSVDLHKITYLSDGLKVNGFLVKPKKEGKYPCVIYNRGGNRDFGALSSSFSALELGRIAKEGYVVIASQYRGNGGSEGQEEFWGSDVNDVTILTEVLKEVKEADVSRIGMFGWSRGGMMTYIALTKTDKVKVAVVGGANSDLTIIERKGMESGVYAELIPDYENNKELELKKRSAIHWVEKFPKDVPILLLHGNSDWRVKSSNSLKLALEFEKHRVPYRLKIFEGADHGINEFKNEMNDEVINWLDKYLKNEEPLPDMEYHGR